MYKHILVAVDGSATAELALQEAIRLAVELQVQLRIVNMVDVININLGTDFPTPPEMSEAIAKSGQSVLDKAGTVTRHVADRNPVGRNRLTRPAHPGNGCRRGRRLAGRPDRHRHPWSPRAEPFVSGQCRRGGAREATKPVLLIRGK